ncbi:hypothetical protein N579_00630 [Corynebacterium pseudodiphtheriticum 090104]|nr:hypothetical protein N579_00630 [Corynebacterium pseudodiphtheriticum 090104]
MSVGHVGTAIARSLELHDVPRIFQVPGESFLPVLDGLYESSIDTVVCRQEGGACYMAEAHGKATGQPGVAMVTRGPGAANAFVGIHTAWQDATPLVLFVGWYPPATATANPSRNSTSKRGSAPKQSAFMCLTTPPAPAASSPKPSI